MSHAATQPRTFPRSSTDTGHTGVILKAAESCFSGAGYAGASMREIAELAGVSKSLLHYHFQSKEHLFVEVQIRAYERLAARVTSAVSAIASGPERGLAAFDALCASLRETNDMAVQAELWAAAMSNDKLRVHVTRMREFFRDLLVRSITRILGPEAARLPLGAEGAADLVWATLSGISVAEAFGDPPERIERCVQALRVLVGVSLSPRENEPPAEVGDALREA